jgi:serine/threonine-protein kinase
MPLLEGQSLKELLAHGPLPVLPVLWIARQIAEGLAALVRSGWIHGDLKPSNIHVSSSGAVTLLDLGFARRLGESGWQEYRVLLGTPRYMAPEVLTSASAASPTSDLYSLGVILFEMLTGRVPFEVNDPAELALLAGAKDCPHLRSSRRDVPARLDRLVRRLLARNPLRRPHSPEEVIDELVDLEIELLGRSVASQAREGGQIGQAQDSERSGIELSVDLRR